MENSPTPGRITTMLLSTFKMLIKVYKDLVGSLSG